MLCFLIFFFFFFFWNLSIYGDCIYLQVNKFRTGFRFLSHKLKWVSLNLLICNLDFKHWIYAIVPVEDLASFVKWQILNFGAIINVGLELHGFTCYFS